MSARLLPIPNKGEDQKSDKMKISAEWDASALQALAEFLLSRALRRESEKQDKLKAA